jgi:VRR-NUC domain
MSSISQADYLAMLARLDRNPLRDAKPSPGVERERQLHEQIIEFCRFKGWLVIHSRMDRPSTVRVGVADFVICADGGQTYLVECKRAGSKLRPEQAAWLAQARHLGHCAAVVRSMSDFLELIRSSEPPY